MAKKSPKKSPEQKSPEQFVIEVATDPKKLGEFILDPEKAMKEAKFTEKERAKIKKTIALEACRKLLEAYDVTYVTGGE